MPRPKLSDLDRSIAVASGLLPNLALDELLELRLVANELRAELRDMNELPTASRAKLAELVKAIGRHLSRLERTLLRQPRPFGPQVSK